jgi:CitMHS family citrate-Mg2+:H+ or citrate-Ca2+:H+ symporter
MLLAALAGALAAGHGIPARHIAEGSITYLDINLIFISATLFMNILKESGGIAFAVRSIIKTFQPQPGAAADPPHLLLPSSWGSDRSCSVTVLITGGMVAIVLGYMGISKLRIAAIVFLIAGLSAAAPPLSLWAMMTAAGVNMPNVGFFLPLLIPCVIGALFTVFLPRMERSPSRCREGPDRTTGAATENELDENHHPILAILRTNFHRS